MVVYPERGYRNVSGKVEPSRAAVGEQNLRHNNHGFRSARLRESDLMLVYSFGIGHNYGQKVGTVADPT